MRISDWSSDVCSSDLDGENWILLNASPDLRQQIFERRQLPPREGVRHSPIHAVVLTNGDVDHVAGLLSLRERHPLAVFVPRPPLSVLQANPPLNWLAPAIAGRPHHRDTTSPR